MTRDDRPAIRTAAALTAAVVAPPALGAPVGWAAANSDKAAEALEAELAQGPERSPSRISSACTAWSGCAKRRDLTATWRRRRQTPPASRGPREARGDCARERQSRPDRDRRNIRDPDAAIVSNGYALQEDGSESVSTSAAYVEAAPEISAAFEGACRAGEANGAQVLAAERERLDAALEALDPERHGPADLPDCTALDRVSPGCARSCRIAGTCGSASRRGKPICGTSGSSRSSQLNYAAAPSILAATGPSTLLRFFATTASMPRRKRAASSSWPARQR